MPKVTELEVVKPRSESRLSNSRAKTAQPPPPPLRRLPCGWKSGVPFPLAAYLQHDLEDKIKVNFTLTN